jgi:hypothetical protein
MLEQAPSELNNQFLRLMDVGVVETLQQDQPHGVQFSPLQGGERLRWVPCRWVVLGEEEARQTMLSGEIDFDLQVVIETPDVETATGLSCASPPETAPTALQEISLITQEADPNRLEVDLKAPGAGWLVLSDVWYPGWRAWVDGRPVQILRANFLFRAIRVEPGDRQVIFTFQPFSFWLGLGLSLFSAVALAALAVWFWRSNLRTAHGS